MNTYTPSDWNLVSDSRGATFRSVQGAALMNTYTRGEGNLVTCGERIVCDAFSGADANRIVCEHNAHGDMLKALRDLVADKYLSDPINTERMAPARDAIAKAEGCK